MSELSWRKHLAILKNRLYLYPEPEPMERTRGFWLAMGVVAALVALFVTFYVAYLARMQDAFQTPAEDVGIMDQALWSMIHGQLFHQTICNIISDTNCYSPGGVPRFAIHFEPILFPLSLLYALWPGPKMLILLQALGVASGAFPTFWLARLRLRSNLAGAGMAALYLLYPQLQQEEIGYFHAVVLVTALLMFTLYFLYTRRTRWLFVFALLSMACKEEIPLVIAMLGLWSLIFQRRWRSGLGLIGMAVAWLGLALLVFRLASPTGQPMLASRYAYLGSNVFEIVRTIVLHPVRMLEDHVFEPTHFFSLRLLLSPVSYLALLAPWVLIITLPSLALDLLSIRKGMYQFAGQYSAEIVPMLIFATIEALVVAVWLIQWISRRAQMALARRAAAKIRQAESDHTALAPRPMRLNRRMIGSNWLQPVALFLLLALTLLSTLRHDQTYGVMPYTRGFTWPQVTAHEALAQRFIDMIPASASVSAQSSLVPHLSHRTDIYLFPYADNQAEYVFLDVTSDNYPYGQLDYRTTVRKFLLQGSYGIVAAEDGYLLLKRGLPGPGLSPASPTTSGPNALPNLPEAFCSFTQVAPQAETTPVQVDFTMPSHQDTSGTVSLVGFQVKRSKTQLQVATYWKVDQGTIPPLRIYTSLLNRTNQEILGSDSSMQSFWCPSSTWKPGTTVLMQTDTLNIAHLPGGLSHLMLSLLPYETTSGTINTSNQGLSPHIVQAPAAVTVMQGRALLQLQTFTL
ncbi:MAG TPA: DUF2079 domain-containing protein [Ktedonobacteraceae bacterium]|nr:DUF2079 domain-containing protein [Ktedonobacteraceae bacterium]